MDNGVESEVSGSLKQTITALKGIIMTLQQALERRRSVRHYGDSPIDADIVRQCLRLAQLAPSSSNMQLYEFYHITDAAVLKQLAEACLGQKAAATAPQPRPNHA